MNEQKRKGGKLSIKGKSKFLSKDVSNKKKEANALDIRIQLLDELRREKFIKGIMFFVIVILIVICAFLSIRNRYIPFIVEVKKETGEIENAKIISNTKLNMSDLQENQINYFISNFITNIRSVTYDKKLYQRKLDESNFFLTAESQKELKTALIDNKTAEKMEKGVSVNVQIKNFNKIEDGKYQITWQETYTSTDGTFKENFLGIFTVDTIPVTNQKMIQDNPLGILITKLSISKTN